MIVCAFAENPTLFPGFSGSLLCCSEEPENLGDCGLQANVTSLHIFGELQS